MVERGTLGKMSMLHIHADKEGEAWVRVHADEMRTTLLARTDELGALLVWPREHRLDIEIDGVALEFVWDTAQQRLCLEIDRRTIGAAAS